MALLAIWLDLLQVRFCVGFHWFIFLLRSSLKRIVALAGRLPLIWARVKNIVGGFYHPKIIFIDVGFLQTLNARELKAGLAEVVKYAVIMDDELFNYLEANVENIIAKDPDVLEKLVRRCCEHKIAVCGGGSRKREQIAGRF